MAKVTTKQELKDHALRKCGSPVVEINIATEQVDDAVDDAIEYFQAYHLDGSERTYLIHQITQAEKNSREIVLPDDVISVNNVLSINWLGSATVGGDAMFDVEYQLYSSDIFSPANSGLTDFYLAKTYLSLIDDVLNGDITYTFHDMTNKLTIYDDWDKYNVDDKIALEVFRRVDPEAYPELYNHWVLKLLTAAYVKKQWGQNLIKFEQIQLPGGTTLNGSRILEEANREIEEINREYIIRYQEPPMMITA